jgi:DNA-binding winged helix-turn-helix (wHTH) protein
LQVHFADCMLDADARTVWRGTTALHLSPKAFDLLALLVQHRSRVVTKRELLGRIWPDVFVSDASLARVVRELRQALGDSPHDARIVRTVYGYGYAFAAQVVGADRSRPDVSGGRAVCWVTTRTRSFGLVPGEHVIGRDPDVEIWLDSPKVSRRHARILVTGSAATLEDLSSKNGTFVGAVPLTAPARLEPGDVIRIGPFALTFRAAPVLPATETESRLRRGGRSQA